MSRAGFEGGNAVGSFDLFSAGHLDSSSLFRSQSGEFEQQLTVNRVNGSAVRSGPVGSGPVGSGRVGTVFSCSGIMRYKSNLPEFALQSLFYV